MLAVSSVARAQLYQVPFEEKFQNASLIAEGKVVDRYCFWNPAHTMIYTASTVSLSKVFSGNAAASTLEVMTVGGIVGTDGVTASDLLALSVGDQGVFFLQPNSLGLHAPVSGRLLYDVYSSMQGFFGYDKIAHSAAAPFVSYASIKDDLYTQLISRAGHPYTIVGSSEDVEIKLPMKTEAPSITGFSPTHVRAGAHSSPANNTLTINGSGFGTASGSAAVLFRNPDVSSGTISIPYSSALVTSWSNTQIIIKVPQNAGTGTIQVVDNGAVSGTSGTSLIVDYAVMSVDFGAGVSSGPEEVNLMSYNSSGGYTITYSTSTAGGGVNIVGSNEQAAFQRALNTHRQLIGFNVTDSVNNTTLQTVTSDKYNIIQFDNTNTGVSVLGSGTLGVCYSYYTKCGNTIYGAQKRGFDITIRNNAVSTGGTSTITFVSGPCPPASTDYNAYDLETVLLHELGHAESQNHIIEAGTGSSLPAYNPAAVMHYALTNGTKRTSPDNALLSCGQYAVATSSNIYGNCGIAYAEMTPLATSSASRDECSAVTFGSTLPLSGNSVAFDLSLATYNRTTDPQATAYDGTGNNTSLTNTQYYAFKTASTGGALTIRVSGYATSPVAQSACSGAGVSLAVYQASSCPTGGAYPAPIAYRTFNANGTLTAISGLAANTSYLIVADGLESTKASFSLSFTGTALPMQVLQFDGRADQAVNVLSWTIIQSNLSAIALERSADGKSFETIASFAQAADKSTMQQDFRDENYTAGTSYYRLSATGRDGSVSYSNVVPISRSTSATQINIAPNPSNSDASLQYTAAVPEDVQIIITSITGAVVYKAAYGAMPGSNKWTLPGALLPAGAYNVSIRHGGEGRVDVLRFFRQ